MLRAYDSECLADYVFIWKTEQNNSRYQYQFMDYPQVFKSVVYLLDWLESLGYYNKYELWKLKIELAARIR